MKLKKTFCMMIAAILTDAMTAPTAFASTDNPLMGDEQGRYIGVVIAVAAVALVVIIIIAVMSAKKGGK